MAREIRMAEWNCGLCIEMEVHIPVNKMSERYEVKSILVPIQRFMEGDRVFGYITGHGAEIPSHKLNKKQEADIIAFIEEWREYQKMKRTLNELEAKLYQQNVEMAKACPHFHHF